jgi:hypothetical protein
MNVGYRSGSFIKLLVVTLLTLIIISCSSTKNLRSRVLDFQYGGYSDTIYALIEGEVYERGSNTVSKDSLSPIGNVQIKVEQNNRLVSTDSAGKFFIGLSKGVFSFLLTKEGYQSLRITNYISDPDQVSSAKIVLEKGRDLITFEIPSRKIK